MAMSPPAAIAPSELAEQPSAALTQPPRWVRVAALVLLAAAIRCTALSALGFAEDEMDIVRAVRAYRRLDFSANAEHPMLPKVAALASVQAADRWNALAVRLWLPVVSPETAVRLPMAVAGALTTAAMFFLAERLFGPTVALWAGFLWAVDVNAVAINRTAKEDTALVLFLIAAAWLYERGKHVGRRDPVRAQRSYAASAAAFGLMLASKYMPGYLGIHALFNHITDLQPGRNRPRLRLCYPVLVITFLVANFAVLTPPVWRHVGAYLAGDTVIHHGYRFAQRLYTNVVEATPWGVPWRYYFVFLATKVPVLVLVAFMAGLWRMRRAPDERGFVFSRVFLVFALLPLSLMASKFVRYMLPLLAIVDLLAATGIVWLIGASTAFLRRLRPVWNGGAIAAGVALVFAAAPVVAIASAAPTFGLYQNAVGTVLAPPGFWFADDEFNDAGVREAVAEIARLAKPGAAVASDAAAVVAEYLALDGRPDMQSLSFSADALPLQSAEVWALVQEGHVYFENEDSITVIRQRFTRWRDIRAGGVVAVEVFRFDNGTGAPQVASKR